MDVADRRLDLELVDRVREHLDLEAYVLGFTRVHGPEPDRSRRIEFLRALLLIGRFAEEERAVHAQPAVAQIRLHAALERLDLLDVERRDLQRIRGPRPEAAAAKPRRPLHVSHQVVSQLPVQADLRRRLLRVDAHARCSE